MGSNEKIIDELAHAKSVPVWWLEHLIIEYLPCRRYFENEEIWSIDYSLIKPAQVSEIINNKIVIPASTTIYHHVKKETLRDNFLKSFVGLPLEPVSPDFVVEGKADSDFFPIAYNPPDVWDPKLTFNNYCLILDGNSFYQWKVAEFHPIEGSTRGWFKSEIVDLTNLRTINEKIQLLRDKRRQEKGIDINLLRNEAEIAYNELEQCRLPIRKKLLEYHESKKEEL